jgi:imidazolonepropionase-like amidohydrolase/ABC-type multidrug transport system permease subunit
MKSYIAQIKSNLRLMGRDRSVLFFSYLFPLTFFFIFAQAFDAAKSPAAMAQVIAMVIIIGVLGQGFFGAGMRTVQDRETNVLRRFKVAPITAAPLIVASLVSGLVAFLPTVCLFLIFGHSIYHAAYPPKLLSLFVFVSIGVIAFRSMGMIIAAVANSVQETQILIQILYLPMLFLSGATFPISMMPLWIQTVAQFLPATYLFQGVQSILIAGESVWTNWFAVLALTITLIVAMFIGVKLFRWEKEEKIQNKAKLWILAVLAPFFIMGLYQARTKQNIEKAKILTRNAMRNRTVLYQNARVIVGNGAVIPNGAVLVRNGKIAEVFKTPPTDTKALEAEVVDASGKTLMPGLIDMHVHIGAPGGVYTDPKKYMAPYASERRLAAYLYSGITAVRSTGDWLNGALKLRDSFNSGEYLGAEFFTCGPLFTTEGGHPLEMLENIPATFRNSAREQFVRLPQSSGEARTMVDQLKRDRVDCIKSVLEAGSPAWRTFNHLDPNIYRAVMEQAHADNLPTATHTGNAADVKEAADASSSSIEHGSMRDAIPGETFDELKQKGLAYDPTLSVIEGTIDVATGNPAPLNASLVQQVGPADLLADTRAFIEKRTSRAAAKDMQALENRVNENLMNAYKAGVLLIAGSDAGNTLVIHGPTIQHELQLWVKAGIPAAIALQAATYNAAKVLRADDRIGSIQKGRDATLILLDGDPLENISNLERISQVMFRGERVSRSELFDQFSK